MIDLKQNFSIYCENGQEGMEVLKHLEHAFPTLRWGSGFKPTAGPMGKINKIIKCNKLFTINYCIPFNGKGHLSVDFKARNRGVDVNCYSYDDIIFELGGNFVFPSNQDLMEFLEG